MRYLIDTHTLIWFLAGDPKLSETARNLIDDSQNTIFVSIASLWEMAIKYSAGKLSLAIPFGNMFPAELYKNSIETMGISIDHLKELAEMPFHHRDPFDRIIVAQSCVENIEIISIDATLDSYNIRRIWSSNS